MKKIFWTYIPVYKLEWSEYTKGGDTLYFSEILSKYDRDEEKWVQMNSIEFTDPEASEHLEIPELTSDDFDLPQKVEDQLLRWKKEGMIIGFDIDTPYQTVFKEPHNQEKIIDGRDYQKDMVVVAVLVEAPEDKMKEVEEWFPSIEWYQIDEEDF